LLDTFPLLLKEGKLFNAVFHSSPELRLRDVLRGGSQDSYLEGNGNSKIACPFS
jgi:hypothetical protein